MILEAAEAQLGERGLHGARMEDIAARAGVSVGSIYNHVGDRSSLLKELFMTRRAELIARVDAVLKEVEGEPVEQQLLAFVQTVFDHFNDHLALFRAVVQEEMSPVQGRPKHAALQLLTERASELLARGVAQGTFDPESAELAPVLLVGMMRGVFVQALGSNSSLQDAATRVVRVFVHGVRRP